MRQFYEIITFTSHFVEGPPERRYNAKLKLLALKGKACARVIGSHFHRANKYIGTFKMNEQDIFQN